MQDQSQKRDAGKMDPLLIEEDLAYALEAVNAVLEYGKAKYGSRGGWKSVDMQRYHKAWGRHRRDRMKFGFKSKDEETNLLHAFHEVCNGLFIINDYMEKLTPAQRKKAQTFK